MNNQCNVTGIDHPSNTEKSVDFKLSYFQQKLLVEILNEEGSPLRIYDLNGKLIESMLPNKGSNTYDLNLKSGLYLAQYMGRTERFLVP
ncbi:MAG: T9SS type A sorting domain-containing protein [Saprospiraceae bacterium]|nr:T9SS type A sorting domain-containing protein [Candidatus Vicinibacter affinis]